MWRLVLRVGFSCLYLEMNGGILCGDVNFLGFSHIFTIQISTYHISKCPNVHKESGEFSGASASAFYKGGSCVDMDT